MATNNTISVATLHLPTPIIHSIIAHKTQHCFPSSTHLSLSSSAQSESRTQKPVSDHCHRVIRINPITASGLLLAGIGFAVMGGDASAAELHQQLSEPANALSLPTWAVHVSSVVEWITAMALVWQYAEKSGYESWKGLSWGMVPLLGGALCACTWHFFYNSESLEVLVPLQAALTVIGNATMCIAAFRIYKSGESTKNL